MKVGVVPDAVPGGKGTGTERDALADFLRAARLAASRLDSESPWGIAAAGIAEKLSESLRQPESHPPTPRQQAHDPTEGRLASPS
jgi:hypothetical protein